jgi:hypothetical protein
VICTTTFEGLARRAAEALGAPGLPLLVIQHPLGGLRVDEVGSRVDQASEQLAGLLRPADGRGRR